MAVNVLRTLLVRLGVSVTPQTKEEVKEFNARVEQVKGTLRDAVTWTHRLAVGLATVATAGAAAMLGLTTETGKHAAEIGNQARLLLMSRKEYQEWLFVADKAGANAGDLADAFLQLNDAAQRAISGEKSMVETWKNLGIQAKQLQGLNPGQIFELMAQQASAATDRQKALAAASSLLGEEASRQFGPMMMKGVAAIRAMRQEAHDLGVVLRDDQLAALAASSTEYSRLRDRLKSLRVTLAAALAPTIYRILRSLNEWLKANRELIAQRVEEWTRRLTDALRSLHNLVQAIGGWDVVLMNVATGLGMLTLLANLKRVETFLASLQILWKGMAVVGGMLATALGIPLGVLVGILAGLVFFVGLFALALEDAWVWLQGGNSLIGRNLDLIEQWIPAFGAVRELFWALAEVAGVMWKNAWRAADAIWQGMAPAFEALDKLIQPLIDKLMKLWGWWEKINAKAGGFIEGITAGVRAIGASGDAGGQVAAGMMQRAVAGSVTSGIQAAGGAASFVANHANTETINQFNQFMGATAREIAEGVNQHTESARRKARAAAAGGPR